MVQVKFTAFSSPGSWSETVEALFDESVSPQRAGMFASACESVGIDLGSPAVERLVNDLEFIRPPEALAQMMASSAGVVDAVTVDALTTSIRLASAYVRRRDADADEGRKLLSVPFLFARELGVLPRIERWHRCHEQLLTVPEWDQHRIHQIGANQPQAVVAAIMHDLTGRFPATKRVAGWSATLDWLSDQLRAWTTRTARYRGPVGEFLTTGSDTGTAMTPTLFDIASMMDCLAAAVHRDAPLVLPEFAPRFQSIVNEYLNASVVFAATIYRSAGIE